MIFFWGGTVGLNEHENLHLIMNKMTNGYKQMG